MSVLFPYPVCFLLLLSNKFPCPKEQSQRVAVEWDFLCQIWQRRASTRTKRWYFLPRDEVPSSFNRMGINRTSLVPCQPASRIRKLPCQASRVFPLFIYCWLCLLFFSASFVPTSSRAVVDIQFIWFDLLSRNHVRLSFSQVCHHHSQPEHYPGDIIQWDG